MQPDEAIAAVPASMALHADVVAAISTEVATARAAAAQVRLDSGAYGIVCAPVPLYLNGLSDGLMAGLSGAVASLQNTSDDLRSVAAELAAANADAQAYVVGEDE